MTKISLIIILTFWKNSLNNFFRDRPTKVFNEPENTTWTPQPPLSTLFKSNVSAAIKEKQEFKVKTCFLLIILFNTHYFYWKFCLKGKTMGTTHDGSGKRRQYVSHCERQQFSRRRHT